jgi:3-keto-disaccharide hydrolase
MVTIASEQMRTTAQLFAFISLLITPAITFTQESDGWIRMFDGKTLNGWKANENPESWSVRGGSITGDGEKSHLFWMMRECRNCEFKADVKISNGGNSGMYFRTAFGPGFPKGYEAQVNSTHQDPVRTGSLYNFAPVYQQLVPPDAWFSQRIIAVGNHIIIEVNGKKVVDYVDAKNTYSAGYLALQQHNKGSVVQFNNLMMKPVA